MKQGFSLIELSVILAIIGMVVGMSVMVGGERIRVTEVQNTWNELQTIKKALDRYSQKYGRLPCPSPLVATHADSDYGYEATTCTTATPGITSVEYPASSGKNVISGMLPFKTLQLSDAFAADQWDNRYNYSVSEPLITEMTADTDGNIAISAANSDIVSEKTAYIVLSYGDSGKGATRHTNQALVATCGSTTTHDSENCNGDGIFRDDRLNESKIDANFYDDWIIWQTRSGALATAANTKPKGSCISNVEWTDAVGVTVAGNNLTKSAGAGWANGGAVSTQSIEAGSDGYVEMTAQETNRHRMFGVSDVNTNAHFNTIDYAIYLVASTVIQIRENGTSKGNYGNYAAGDVLRVVRAGTNITYEHNDTVIYTSLIPSTTSLIADTSLYTTSSTITDAKINTCNSSSGPYVNCMAAKNAGNNTDGIYSIDPDGSGGVAAFDAYCDMTTDGGGWMLVDNDASTSTWFTSRTAGANTDLNITKGSLLPAYTWSASPQLMVKSSQKSGSLGWVTFNALTATALSYPTSVDGGSAGQTGNWSYGTLNGNTERGTRSWIYNASGRFGSIWIGNGSDPTAACGYTSGGGLTGLGVDTGGGPTTCSTWVR